MRGVLMLVSLIVIISFLVGCATAEQSIKRSCKKMNEDINWILFDNE